MERQVAIYLKDISLLRQKFLNSLTVREMSLETRLQGTRNSYAIKLYFSFNDQLVVKLLNKNINFLKDAIFLCKEDFLLVSKILSYIYGYLCNIWTHIHSKLAFTVERKVKVNLVPLSSLTHERWLEHNMKFYTEF